MSWVRMLYPKDVAQMVLRMKKPTPSTIENCITHILKNERCRGGEEALDHIHKKLSLSITDSLESTNRILTACSTTTSYRVIALRLKTKIELLSGQVIENKIIREHDGVISLKRKLISVKEQNTLNAVRLADPFYVKTLSSKQLIVLLQFKNCSKLVKNIIASQFISRREPFPYTATFLCEHLCVESFSVVAVETFIRHINMTELSTNDLGMLSKLCQKGFKKGFRVIQEARIWQVTCSLFTDIVEEVNKRIYDDEIQVGMGIKWLYPVFVSHAVFDLNFLRSWSQTCMSSLLEISSFLFTNLGNIESCDRTSVLSMWISILVLTGIRPREFEYLIKMQNGILSQHSEPISYLRDIPIEALLISLSTCNSDFYYSHITEEILLKFNSNGESTCLAVSLLLESEFHQIANKLFVLMLRTMTEEKLHQSYELFPLEMRLCVSETFGITNSCVTYCTNPELSPAVLELSIYNVSKGLL